MDLTGKQREVLEMLKDGRPISRKAIMEGPLQGTGWDNVGQFMARLNRKLVPRGMRIIPVASGKFVSYQWVRLLHGSQD